MPVRKKYDISFLEQPLFAQQLGVFSTQKLSDSEFEIFLILLKKKFKLVSNYPFSISNYQEYRNSFDKIFEKQSLKKYCTHHLSLLQEYAQIRQKYSRDTKYRINQAQKQNFEVLESSDIDLLYTFFERSVFLEDGISKEAKPILKNLFDVLNNKNMTTLCYVRNQNKEILSGVLFVKDKTIYQNKTIIKWIYLFNAANTNIKERNESRRWFLDKFIRENSYQKDNFGSEKVNKENILDFESAQEPKVARFYASFGSEEKVFYVLNYNNLSAFIKIAQRIVQFIKNKIL
ncbi:hypothetical protein [Bernardetia sp.]|uniref:hypothetical protein n=1 Tax=Bernardetia sp. TaxID=1937974 RepID=UPI0025B8B8AB|nr:hypothetical protein [Bernardetia sp.]